jgi:hypothetical protein
MLYSIFSNLLIWPGEAGKGEKMSCNYKENVVPVFGKEPGTGIFIARRES